MPISSEDFKKQNCEIHIYRGDLEHASAPGNKWHKLKHHLKEAERRKAKTIATFGGPFSNHLHAFAMTLEKLPFKSIAVVRGELQPQLTPTLKDAIECGVELWPSSRSDYRKGLESDVVSQINKIYEDVYWIPEGGGGELGAQGCLDWASNIANLIDNDHAHYDAWVVSAGTGTTAAGFLAYQDLPDFHVISALKGAEEQRGEILKKSLKLSRLNQVGELNEHDHLLSGKLDAKLFFHSNAHEGGYAKHSKALKTFIYNFTEKNPDVVLDPVYTAKSLFAIHKLIGKGQWPYSRTLFIHTGGIQGWRGYPEKKKVFNKDNRLSE